MPVSVLIPAFRDTYLTQTLGSVLSQTYRDLEIIVSDDSLDERVQNVVQNFKDSRIKYVRTTGGIGAVANICSLWEMANEHYLKFLFDDDFLDPFSVASLVESLKSIPACSFSFSHRFIVDHHGCIIGNPTIVEYGKRAIIPAAAISSRLPGRVENPIGELSNVLINRDICGSSTDFSSYKDFDVEVLGDVALYLNATQRAPCVGLGLPLSAFRRHANQNSSPNFNRSFAAGLFEWELFIRGEYSGGNLSSQETLNSLALLGKVYSTWTHKFPELNEFSKGLDQLRQKVIDNDRSLLDGFREIWISAWNVIRSRASR